jgi:hypothetical protein
MIYLKSVLAGILAVLVLCVIVVAGLFLTVWFIPSIFMSASTGSGGIGAVSSGLPELVLLLVLALAFAGAFYWQFRRGSRPRS